MVYLGSKSRLAKELVPIIQEYIDKSNCNTYIELFVGGANIIDKIKCENKLGFDYNEDLICLLQYAQNDTELSIAPKECSFEHYKEVRKDKECKSFSKEYRALIGYMASYGGRYFDGGYGRDNRGGKSIYKERLNNFKKQTPLLQNIKFECMDYINLDISKYQNCVFYLDPPYINTKKFAKQSIDYEDFYNFCRKLSKNNIVLISEFYMPDDFKCIWEKERKILMKSDRQNGLSKTEKLYIYKGNL